MAGLLTLIKNIHMHTSIHTPKKNI